MGILLDLLQVSRPGWWLVTVWLYVAPYGGTAPDWAGLMFVCLPLNAFLYAMNDYADHKVDMGSARKGNWVFGPQGWTKDRIQLTMGIACGLTLIPLVYWGMTEGRALWYVWWFLSGVAINMLYNSGVIPSPWELVLVYLGFGTVTILSYWRSGPDASSMLGLSYTNAAATWYFAGCNGNYWIHLSFLIARSQLWTEYMDYESDRLCSKWTTLSRLSKDQARSVVFSILLCEAAWTCSQARQDADWFVLATFSIMGLALFLIIEYGVKGISAKELIALAGLQTVGGIHLLYDTWSKGVFVK
jgi:4-hydroxybenzoate polyprenyltransferase